MLNIQEHNGVVCAYSATRKSRGNMGVYVFYTDGMLIDTGPKSLLKKFIPFFKEMEFSKVMITHHHEDHIGGARWIQQNKKVPIYINRDAIDICLKKADYPLYRQIVWGVREPFNPQPLESPFYSNCYTWEAIHTPGHAPDHFAFLNKEKGILFSGDLYVNPRPRLMLSFESVPLIMESLRKLLTYDFTYLFCSHTGFYKKGKEVLARKLNYLQETSEEVIYLYEQGLTVKEIQEKMMPKNHPLIFVSNHEYDYRYFITSVLEQLAVKK